jgi:hypothetical protein
MFPYTDLAADVTAPWISRTLPPQGLTLWIKKAAPYFTIHVDAVYNIFPMHTQNLIFTLFKLGQLAALDFYHNKSCQTQQILLCTQ